MEKSFEVLKKVVVNDSTSILLSTSTSGLAVFFLAEVFFEGRFLTDGVGASESEAIKDAVESTSYLASQLETALK